MTRAAAREHKRGSESKLGMVQTFELTKHTPSDILCSIRPHPLTSPNSTTSGGWGDLVFQCLRLWGNHIQTTTAVKSEYTKILMTFSLIAHAESVSTIALSLEVHDDCNLARGNMITSSAISIRNEKNNFLCLCRHGLLFRSSSYLLVGEVGNERKISRRLF